MEVVQARHNRHGLSGDCSLSSFANISSCANHPNDNNGLWTSLVVAAEAFRYLLTGEEVSSRTVVISMTPLSHLCFVG